MPVELEDEIDNEQDSLVDDIEQDGLDEGTPDESTLGDETQIEESPGESPAAFDLFSAARDAGLSDDYIGQFKDPSQLFTSVLDAMDYQKQQAEQQQQLLNERLAGYQHWYEQQQQAQAAEAAKVPVEPEKPYWEPLPEYHPEWRSYLRTDPETGEISVKPGGDPSLPQKIATHEAALRDRLMTLAADPFKAIEPALEPFIKKLVEPLVQQRLDAVNRQWETARYVDQRLPQWQNADGTWNQDGLDFARFYEDSKRMHPSLGQEGWRANAELLMTVRGTPAQAAGPEKPKPPTKRQALLRNGNRAPSTGAGLSATARAGQNDQAISLYEMAAKTFE